MTIQIDIKIKMLYDKSSFFKTIGNVFRTDYVCSLSSQFTLLIIKIYSFSLDLKQLIDKIFKTFADSNSMSEEIRWHETSGNYTWNNVWLL